MQAGNHLLLVLILFVQLFAGFLAEVRAVINCGRAIGTGVFSIRQVRISFSSSQGVGKVFMGLGDMPACSINLPVIQK
jgi:hypothetical protein